MSLHRQIPINKDASTVEKCWMKVRGQTISKVPLESGLSLPIPLILEKDNVCLLGFYFKVKNLGGPGKIKIQTPIASVIASFPEGEVVTLRKEEANVLFPGVDLLEDSVSLDGLSPKEVVQKRREYYNLLSGLIPKYLVASDPSAEEILNFQECFSMVAEKPLLNYYVALNPHFFSWIKG